MAKYTAPASKGKPRIPIRKPHKGVLSARHGDSHPVTDHKGGGHRMTKQSGKRLPFNV
jgi:hypothetical protein